MESATAKCAAGTLRRASRSLRVYDARLARVEAHHHGSSPSSARSSNTPTAAPLTELADKLVFERTSSLPRARTAGARRAGSMAPDGRTKQVALTTRGRRRTSTRHSRHWNAAQEELRVGHFGRAAWNTLSAQLVDIVDIARAMPAAER